MKHTLFCRQFCPQNAENRILGLLNFKPFEKHVPRQFPPPHLQKGTNDPLWYSRLSYSNLLGTSIFIETPVKLMVHGLSLKDYNTTVKYLQSFF